MDQEKEQAIKHLAYLKSIIEALQSPKSIKVQLLRKNGGGSSLQYYLREIDIEPLESLKEFIRDISRKYEEELKRAESADQYTGDIVKGCIYRLPVNDQLIDEPFRKLKEKTNHPAKEGDVLEGRWDALLIMCRVRIDGQEKPVMLVSMRSPVSVLHNKFIFSEEDRFEELTKPVLTLNRSLDAVIAGGTFYMLTMQAENLFDMERSYKNRCKDKVREIIEMEILSNSAVFDKVAKRGQNPRRFVSFNQRRLEAITTDKDRRRYLRKFNIRVVQGRIDTDDPQNCERLIKFLCDKAMLDPVDNEPREVAAAKRWS